MKNVKYLMLLGGILILTMFFTPEVLVHADVDISEYVKDYMTDGNDSAPELSSDNFNIASEFVYGKKNLCKVYLSGTTKTDKKNGIPAFKTDKELKIKYVYNHEYQTDDKDGWNLEESNSTKKVLDIETEDKPEKGTVIVQKSNDNLKWETIQVIYDLFDDYEGLIELYAEDEGEIINGSYYRLIIAYTMKQRTKESSLKEDHTIFDEYSHRGFAEVYNFFVYSDVNHVQITDILSGQEIAPNQNTEIKSGFCVRLNGNTGKTEMFSKLQIEEGGYITSSDSITADYSIFYLKGEYTLSFHNGFGEEIRYNITVLDGMQFIQKSPSVYETDDEYVLTNSDCRKVTNTASGQPSLSEVSVAHTGANAIKVKDTNDSIGINGESAAIFIKLKNSMDDLGNGCKLVYDEYGRKEKHTIASVQTGEVGKGALIIKKSSDGKTWKNVSADGDRYADGLYTTDFATYYDVGERVLAYMPSGKDLINGVYLQVFYAYKLEDAEGDEHNYVERYQFYLCNNNLDAVTVHNLTLADSLSNLVGSDDEMILDIYRKSETLADETCTVTGFSIDTSLNPKANVSVTKNGASCSNLENKYTETGKYHIRISSPMGDVKEMNIYVDRETAEERQKRYFGNCFGNMKRVYFEGDYACFEGGVSMFKTETVSDEYMPICATVYIDGVENPALGFELTRQRKWIQLREPGMYQIVFTTYSSSENEPKGDHYSFTSSFRVIKQGKAPGPQINKKALKSYSQTIQDSYPIYYGVTKHSASGGLITVAFATKDEAKAYAMEYEKEKVEEKENGKFLYTGDLMFDGKKEEYKDGWDIEDAKEYFADLAVQELCFELDEVEGLYTVSDEVINSVENLRTLEFARSVTIFGSGQKEKLTGMNSLCLINDKPYSYVQPGKDVDIRSGVQQFKFTSDKYGCDSASVVITDCNGREYPIKYNISVEEQLADAGCPSGVILIREETYDGGGLWKGDVSEYEALYIAEGENASTIEVNYYSEDIKTTRKYDQNSEKEPVEADSFNIESFSDTLDEYALLVILGPTGKSMFTADMESITDEWAEPGEYVIKCVNRLGTAFSVNVKVKESTNHAVISFEGKNTESLESIKVKRGDKHVMLPQPEQRYGYEFSGWRNEEGESVHDEIDTVDFSGNMVLTANWERKTVTVQIVDIDGAILKVITGQYDKEIDIPSVDLNPGETLVGLKLNGEKYDKNTLRVDSENVIELVAEIKKAPEAQTESHPDNVKGNMAESIQNDGITSDDGEDITESDDDGGQGAGLWIAVVLVSVAGIGGGAGYWIKKKKSEGGISEDKEIQYMTDSVDDDEKQSITDVEEVTESEKGED